jgi:hypothetical protein
MGRDYAASGPLLGSADSTDPWISDVATPPASLTLKAVMPKSRDRMVVKGKKAAAAVSGGRRRTRKDHLHRRRRRRRRTRTRKDHLHSFMLLRGHVTCRERVVPPAATRLIKVVVPATTAVKLSAAPCCHGTFNRDSCKAERADIHEDGTRGELDIYHRGIGVLPTQGANDELILHVDGWRSGKRRGCSQVSTWAKKWLRYPYKNNQFFL